MATASTPDTDENGKQAYAAAARRLAGWYGLFDWPAALEADFQQHYRQRYRSQMVLGLAIGALAILVSLFEDFLIPAEQRLMPLLIRLGVVLPIVLLLVLLISRPLLARWQQSMLMLSTLGGAFAFMMMAFYVSSPLGRIYIDTLMLIQIFGLTLLRMQFAYALACVLVIMSGSAVALTQFDFPGSRAENLIDLMLIVFAGLLCLVANYLMERSARSDFLQQRLLEFGQQELTGANLHLQQLLRTDALTGIANRRHFDAQLEEECRRAVRQQSALALLMLDVDAFKPYNDTYGHQAGDEALVRIAQALARFARRPGDVAARYGGEEFALILPATNEAAALMMAEEVVDYVHALNLPHRSSRVSDRLTVSIGVAALTPGDAGPAALIARADQALYFAKSSGRNRARSWSQLEAGSR